MNRHWRNLAIGLPLIALLFATASCGTRPPIETVDTEVATFPVQDQVFLFGETDAVDNSWASLILADSPIDCTLPVDLFGGKLLLTLELYRGIRAGGPMAIVPGRYRVFDKSGEDAVYHSVRGTIHGVTAPEDQRRATDGLLRLREFEGIDGGRATGWVDFVIGPEESLVMGSFDARACWVDTGV